LSVLFRVQRANRSTEFAELSGLMFLNAMAMGAWFVPLGTVLDSQGLASLKPYAFATSATAAFVSPLIFGAMADRHYSPVRVLRWLALATSVGVTLSAAAIHHHASPTMVLCLIQLQALCSAPIWGLSTSIVLGRLTHPQRQFGPIRALGTLGWMAGCWLVSALHADTSSLACYSSGAEWFLLGIFSLLLPSPPPPPTGEDLSLRQRLGLDALSLFKNSDHRVVFVTAALVSIPLAAFYPYTPAHLRDLGMNRTSAWMSLGQVTEIITMLCLAGVLTRWRLKWIFSAGLAFGLIRYCLCSLDTKGWLLAGLSLHGFAFTLFFITAQIYLDQRVDPAWRSRAQSLFILMVSGVGNLLGYLGTGWWFRVCRVNEVNHWSTFWLALASVIGAVLIYFLFAYRGRGPGSERSAQAI
jgi:nucleoside transporter